MAASVTARVPSERRRSQRPRPSPTPPTTQSMYGTSSATTTPEQSSNHHHYSSLPSSSSSPPFALTIGTPVKVLTKQGARGVVTNPCTASGRVSVQFPFSTRPSAFKRENVVPITMVSPETVMSNPSATTEGRVPSSPSASEFEATTAAVRPPLPVVSSYEYNNNDANGSSGVETIRPTPVPSDSVGQRIPNPRIPTTTTTNPPNITPDNAPHSSTRRSTTTNTTNTTIITPTTSYSSTHHPSPAPPSSPAVAGGEGVQMSQQQHPIIITPQQHRRPSSFTVGTHVRVVTPRRPRGQSQNNSYGADGRIGRVTNPCTPTGLVSVRFHDQRRPGSFKPEHVLPLEEEAVEENGVAVGDQPSSDPSPQSSSAHGGNGGDQSDGHCDDYNPADDEEDEAESFFFESVEQPNCDDRRARNVDNGSRSNVVTPCSLDFDSAVPPPRRSPSAHPVPENGSEEPNDGSSSVENENDEEEEYYNATATGLHVPGVSSSVPPPPPRSSSINTEGEEQETDNDDYQDAWESIQREPVSYQETPPVDPYNPVWSAEGSLAGARPRRVNHPQQEDGFIPSIPLSLETIPSSLPATTVDNHSPDTAERGFPFYFGKHRIGTLHLLLEKQKNPFDSTLASYLFPDRLARVEYNGTAGELENFTAQTHVEVNGYRFELLVQKVHTSDERCKFGRRKRPELVYVATRGPDLPILSVEEVLSSVGDFQALDLAKAVSRMELLFSPAKTVEGRPAIFELPADKFEFIEEDCNEGCGYISRQLVKDWFGSGRASARITSIQVRMIFEGLHKGLLTMAVEDGVDGIKIPTSMIKVAAPNQSTTARFGKNLVLIKNTFPSERNRYLGQALDGKEVCRTGCAELEKPLKDMFIDVLLDAGVDIAMLEEYEEKTRGRPDPYNDEDPLSPSPRRRSFRRPRRAKRQTEQPKPQGRWKYAGDSFFLGAADPTIDGFIPRGHLFIPGLPDEVESVLITRPPCMHRKDLLRLPLLRRKPEAMSSAEWERMESRHVGDVYFGRGFVPLPNLVADGDSDGDLYFVLWDPELVQCVPMADIDRLEREAPRNGHTGSSSRPSSDYPQSGGRHWFERFQHATADVGRTIRITKLIGILYNEAKFAWDADDDMIREDFMAYAEAYKKSLDLKKHGETVALPPHLWNKVPKVLHDLLCLPSDQDSLHRVDQTMEID